MIALKTNKSNFNRYDYFIIVLLASIVFGSYGGSLQPVRILSILAVPIVVNKFHLLYRDFFVKKIIIFFLFWYIYCVASVLWTSNLDEAIKELFYYLIHFNLFFALVLFSKLANRPLISIILGWCLFVLCSLPIAFNEILNNKHLDITKYDTDLVIKLGKGKSVLKRFAATTFYNYNTYNMVLCFAFPFVLSYLLQFTKKLPQLFGWGVVLCVFYIGLTNASRGTVISMAIMMVIFLYFYRKLTIPYKPILYLVLIAAVSYVVWNYSAVILGQFGYRMIGRESILDDSSRSNMISIALNMVVEDLFLGTGVGSLQTSFSQRSGIKMPPHNLFMEILIQYGLVITIGIVLFLISLLKTGWKTRNTKVKFVLYAALIPLPFIAVINSGYLLLPSIWLFAASLFVYSKFSNT